MPTVITQGAASAKGYGFGARSVAATYIEDVFSTYLYTGNSTSLGTQTITNNIDLSTKGGMVWIKGRSAAANHYVADTVRGAGTSGQSNNGLFTNTQDVENGVSGTDYDFISSFGSTGFTVRQYGGTTAERCTNYNGVTYSSWAFRKQAKFFDIVTYTGTGSARTISHSLGSVPGAIFIKARNEVGDWTVYHRSVGNASYLALNSTAASAATTAFNSTTPTSTVFSIGANNTVNRSGTTYVAYLFAHNAGGFGATGTDNVISCGSFTGDGSGAFTVNLGYEPQWILWKSISASQWYIFDTMRGFLSYPVSTSFPSSSPNLADADNARSDFGVTSTGFKTDGGVAPGGTYIYIAIRRGPMKTPTSGTSVFSPIVSSGATGTTLTTNFPVDMQWLRTRDSADTFYVIDRMRGISTTPITASSRTVYTTDTSSEGGTNTSYGWNNTGFGVPTQQGGSNTIYESFRRAPGFFDVVCYTGTGGVMTVNHNLAAVPEMMIFKNRQSARSWPVYTSATGNTQALILNSNAAVNSTGNNYFNSTSPTSTVFTVNTAFSDVGNVQNMVAYLFATCPGVSKVGSYTGTGTTKQIDCGFTGGARFVLIKRTDSTGDWYVWDSARGIVSGNDPYLLLNSTAAEVTNTDYIDTYSAGFEISSTAPAAINANGGSFIFLAIA